jgi:DNA-binding response OmpR family regulator
MEEKIENVNILLCEDDENLGMLLREYLEAKGYNAELCVDGEEGFDTFRSGHFDLCILDVMMPKMDGFTLAKRIREMNQEIPFIFLTAKTLIEDVRAGFEIGADDYITKPFRMDVVVLRIEAILRRVRGKATKNDAIRPIGIFMFDTQKQTLVAGNKVKKLTTKEAELLTLLSNKPNELLPRDFALKSIWIDDNYFNARSMDVYITKLRKHLKDDPNVEILNVHGKGYKLVVSELPA